MVHVFKGYGLLLLLLLTANLHAAPPLSPEARHVRKQAQSRQNKAAAEMKREADQRWKELQAKQAKTNQQRAEDVQRSLAARTPSKQLPPFNPDTAPSPVECLRAFILAARSA